MISRFAKTKPSLLQTAVRSFAQDLEKTITHLNAYHKNQGAKMVEFAGFEMPILFPGEHGGVMKEHLFTRKSCGVFDVSHMGQLHITGKDAAKFLERLTVVDTQALAHGQASLSVIMNEKGGIKDDCIITKVNDTHFYVVLNAGCKEKDMVHMRKHLEDKKMFPDVRMEYHSEQVKSLIALQGPHAHHVLA
jgi:aminomethyltransferase